MPRPQNNRRIRDSDGNAVTVLDKDEADYEIRRLRLEHDFSVTELHRTHRAEQRRTQAERDRTSRRTHLQTQDAILAARRAGLGCRSVSVPLPVVTPNGTTTVGVWVPDDPSLVEAIDVAYLTPPSSALGAITLDVKKVEGGVTTLLQDAAGHDLEGLAAAVPDRTVSPTLAKTVRTLQKGAYVYVEITSNNADAVAGVGGVLTIHYKTCR